MGFIAEFEAKGPGDEDFPGYICRPGFGQRAHQGKQDRTLRQGNRHARTAHQRATSVDHQ
ncbi:hypothetical protein D3C76_1594150 [compost metagenome]